MTISKYTDNLYQSEVYRELERQAVKKGFFKPTDEELVKLAAQEIEHVQGEDQAIVSDDLIQDIARLAYAMRRKGLVTQAEDVEQKLVLFKQAENALYNVTTETNKDFIEFAHRDGDVNLIEGSGDLGMFETLQSVSDKIQAVVRKEPTGKLGALAASIIKSAQEQPAKAESVQEATGKLMEQDPQSIGDSIRICKEGLQTFDGLRRTSPVKSGTVEESYRIRKPDLNDAEISAYVALANASGAKSVSVDGVKAWFNLKKLAAAAGKQFLQSSGNVFYVRLPMGVDLATVTKFADAIGAINIRKTFIDPGAPKPAFDADGGHDDLANRGNYSDCIIALNQAFDSIYASQFGKTNEIVQAVNNTIQGPIHTLQNTVINIPLEIQKDGINECFAKLTEVSRALSEARTTFINQVSSVKIFVDDFVIKESVEWVDGLIGFVKQLYGKLAYAPGMKSVKIDSSELDAAIRSIEEKNPTSAAVQTLKRIQKVIADVSGASWFDIKAAIQDELGVELQSKEQLERELKQMSRWR